MMTTKLLLLKHRILASVARDVGPFGLARDVEVRSARRGGEELAGTDGPDGVGKSLGEEGERLDRFGPQGLEVDLEHRWRRVELA